jgi:DNA-binding transcriptional LysR family regulator
MQKENRNISLKQMRAFVAVAHAGSFTRAAEQLFITQSALSSLIRNLEAELQLRLLDRTTRRLELTDAGAELLQSLEQLLGDIDRMTSDLRDVRAIRRGRVRIGATPLLASTFIPAAIMAFHQQHPGITGGPAAPGLEGR